MVTKWGLSEKMGPLAYSEEQQEVFLGKSASQTNKNMSNETASSIDSEIRRIIDHQYERATKLINDNLDKMHLMADALMKYETIDVAQIDQIMDGKVPDAPDSWSDDDNDSSSGKPTNNAAKDSPSTSPAS
jgi:cell division protease FtsH